MVNSAWSCPFGVCTCFGFNCTLLFVCIVALVVLLVVLLSCLLCVFGAASYAVARVGGMQLPLSNSAPLPPHHVVYAPQSIDYAHAYRRHPASPEADMRWRGVVAIEDME